MDSSDSDIDNDVPDTGAAFTFGKCRDQHEFIPEKYYFKMDAIKQVCCGDRHTTILTHASKLYSFGANEYGQLGHGHNRPVSQPKKIKALRNEPVALVACGRCHTIVYTQSGRMYSCGMNTEGQLGIGRSSNDVTDFKFHLISSLSAPQQSKITKVDCGADHAIALNLEGAAFSWGENELGQLGLGDSQPRNKPCRISLVRESVKDISCGYYHSALVTNSGKLWMFGDGDSGQLGLSSIRVSQKESPECVLKFTQPVDLVSCGMSHTAVVTKSGELFTFGTGKFGQLGHGPLCMRSNLPKAVEALRNVKITQVSCGENHTAVLSEKGQLIMFGDGKDGKLCQVGDEFANVFNPVPVLRFKKFKVLSFSLGACHSVVVATKKNAGSSFDSDDDEDGLAGDAREKIGMYKFDYLGGTSMLRMAAGMRKSATLPVSGVISTRTKLNARDRRRARCMEKERERLSQTLPIHWTKKLGSLPDLTFDSPKKAAAVIDVSSPPSKRSSTEVKLIESGKKPKTIVSSMDEVDSDKPMEDEVIEEPLMFGSKDKNVVLHASAPNLTSITSEKDEEKSGAETTDYEYEYEYGDDSSEINESLDTTNLSEKTADEEGDDDKEGSGKKKGKFLGGIFSRKKQIDDADASFSEKDTEKGSKSKKKLKNSKESSSETSSNSKGTKDNVDEKKKSKDKSSKRISWADEEAATADLSDDDVDAESNDADSTKASKSSKKDKKESKEKEKKSKKEEEKSKKDKNGNKNGDHDSADDENGETKKKEKKTGGGIFSKIKKKKDEVEKFDPNDVPSDTEDEDENSSKKDSDKEKKDKKKGGKEKDKDSKSKDKDDKKKSKEDLTDNEDDDKKSKDKDKKAEKEKEISAKEKEKLEKEKEKQEEKERKEKEKQEEKERKEKEKQEEKERKEKEKKEKEKDKNSEKKKDKEKKDSKSSKSDKKKNGDKNEDDAESDEEGSEPEIEELSDDEKSKSNKKEKSQKKVTINDDKGSVQDISEEGGKKK